MITRSVTVAAAVLVLFLASASGTSILCDPDCSDHNGGDKVEDPRNCHQFYVCIDNNVVSSFPVVCQPPNGIFDPSAGECVEGVECEMSCNAPVCKLKCDGALDLISNPWDCNAYHYCDAAYNAGPAQHCPEDRPYFDGVTCTFEERVCCESPCTPICGSGDVQVLDPFDCTKYYLCLEEGTPTEETHHDCDPGKTFQPTSGLCVTGGTCYTLCESTITTTTEPITTTSTTTTTTTTTPTTTPSDCIQFLTCPDVGYFPMCSSCQPMYFECREVGVSGVPMLCGDGYVFNTVPEYAYCVLEEECPFDPSTQITL